jgi:hypothetical protein
MKFTENDIRDKELLAKLIEEEAQRIFESPKANRGRTLEQITESVKQSKVAELYLVETGEYDFADIKWHDLRNHSGEYVEVKAYNVRDWEAPFVKKDLEKYRTQDWCKSTWYMLFSYDDGTYEYLGTQKIK